MAVRRNCCVAAPATPCGRSVSVYAEELGGSDVVSANLDRTSTKTLLRPCEIPADRVTAFLEGWCPD